MTVTVDSVQHHCSDTARHAVTIATSLLQFPNLVTPNGDGVSDLWEVVNLVADHADLWDPNSPFCPDGTYYFRFMARSEYGIIRQNGTIEVFR